MILGSSPMTSIVGYVLGILYAVKEVLPAQGLPTTTEGWINLAIAFGIAALGRFVKDSNVSNAPVPAPAQPVK